MARNKAIFDADILIHLCKTGSIERILQYFDQIFISDYVFNVEIKADTPEKKTIDKLINKKKVTILKRSNLTPIQKKFYDEAYCLLNKQTEVDLINEGEQVTAAFASAHKVYYYMSDDNKAAPYIRTLTSVNVINYCDLLYISLIVNRADAKILSDYYTNFIALYDSDKIPRILKNTHGHIKSFVEIMASCKMKFDSNKQLMDYLNLLITQYK